MSLKESLLEIIERSNLKKNIQDDSKEIPNNYKLIEKKKLCAKEWRRLIC